jgi:hypothetical protein
LRSRYENAEKRPKKRKPQHRGAENTEGKEKKQVAEKSPLPQQV